MTTGFLRSLFFSMTFVFVLFSGSSFAQDNQTLSAILKSVEEKEKGIITKAAYDEGLWEVKICETGNCQKIYIDPVTWKEIRRRATEGKNVPPANSLSMTVIVKNIEGLNAGKIKEVEFDNGNWKAEVKKDGKKNKLYFDPLTGEQIPAIKK